MVEKGYIVRNSTNGKYIQRVVLKDLLPNRRYCYEITSGQSSSHIYSFRTASFTVDISIKDQLNFHSSFIVNGVDITPSLATSAQAKASSHLLNNDSEKTNSLFSKIIQSFKNQISNKDIHGFINLPLIHLDEYSNNLKKTTNNDFLDLYSDILPNMQILPTIGQLGI